MELLVQLVDGDVVDITTVGPMVSISLSHCKFRAIKARYFSVEGIDSVE